jgi:GMP synthase-like glutamine amidotransferase
LSSLPERFDALQWHSCNFTPGAHAHRLARSLRCAQAYRVEERAWGIQFHAEVTLADFEGWLDHHTAQPDDEDGPADPDALRVAVREGIGAWNALGRAMFGRFLDVAAPAAVRA